MNSGHVICLDQSEVSIHLEDKEAPVVGRDVHYHRDPGARPVPPHNLA